MGRPRKPARQVESDELIPGHRCALCGMPGYPSDFLWHSKRKVWSNWCRECSSRMAQYTHEARRDGRIIAPLEHRMWWKPNTQQETEQRLCWQYIDSDITEEDWDELCDEIAGPIGNYGRH